MGSNTTRRQLLVTAAVTGMVGVAGCSDGGSSESTATENPGSTATETDTPEPTATETDTQEPTATETDTPEPTEETATRRQPAEPDFDGYLADVGNYDGTTTDRTGRDTVTVEVGVEANGGAYGFGPAAVHVDSGTTVQWEWTGNGGGHSVLSEGDGPLDSGDAVSTAGVNYRHTFESDGIYPYHCGPHEALGMRGAIVVGTEYPTAGGADS